MIIDHNYENNKQKGTLNVQEIKTNKNYECRLCNKTYTYRNWHEHMRTVHSNVNLTCRHCGRPFKCQKYLYRHVQNMHMEKEQLKNTGEFFCKQCPKVFNSGDCLNKHVKNCHGETVECQICNSVLKSAVYLSSHMRRVHCDSSKMSKCEICGKQMKSERQVRIHISNSHEKMLCPKCGKILYSSTSYYYHVKNCKMVTQKVKEGKIDGDDMNVDVIVDDNDHVDIENGKLNVHGDVKIDIPVHVNDHLNISDIKSIIETSRVINNPIYHDDLEDVDIDDSGPKTYSSEQVQIGNVSSYHDINGIHGVTVKADNNDHNMNGDSVGVSSDRNGDSNDQRDKGDTVGHFCKICKKKLKSDKRVKIHMRNAHSKKLPIKCPVCGKFFCNLQYFRCHVKKCSKEAYMTLDTNEIKIEKAFKLNEWAFKAL